MHDFCYSGSGVGTCRCLHVLRQPHPRSLVAKYIAYMTIKDLTQKDLKMSLILEWYKYAVSNTQHEKGRNMYPLPFDATNADIHEFVCNKDYNDSVDLATNKLRAHKICQQALYRVMGITEKAMVTIRKAARTGALTPHGNIGKPSNNRLATYNAYSASSIVDDDDVNGFIIASSETVDDQQSSCEVSPRRSNRLLKRKHGSDGVDDYASSASTTQHGTMRTAAPTRNVKLKVIVNGEIICPHLGEDYPRGNMHRKKEVTQKKAATLRRTGQLGGRVVSLLYDEGHVGFCPKNWRFFIGQSDEGRWLLLPSDGDKKGQPHPLYVHRSKNSEENSYLHEVTKTLNENHPQVRGGKGWGGVGSMIGIGEHLDVQGHHCNFVLKDDKRHMWTDTDENLIMIDCGRIFKEHFGGKDVGYDDMIAKQKTVWPTKCPSRLTDHPRSYSASCNLGNELHRDNDAARSFAVWVNEKGDKSKSWYLLFPEWEVAIEVTHGTWISWNGRYCGHCTAVPNVAAGDSLLSLFCTIPKRLYTYLKKRKDGV